VIGVGEVRAPGGHLARRAAQGDRPAGAEVQRLQQGGRRAGQRRRRGQVAQARRRAAPAQPRDDPPFDGLGALGLDELLADGPGERLEGLGAADRAQVRAIAHRAPDERIRAEAVIERAQVVVDAQREAHALQGLLGHVGAVGSGHQHHAVARGLADADDRGHPLDVQQPLQAAVGPSAHDAVAPRPRQAKRPHRTHLSPHLDHPARLYASRPTGGAAPRR
jgi:hypothetical protein